MDNLIIASIQINSSDCVNNNLQKIATFIKQAKLLGAQLVTLPEYAFNIASDNKELIRESAEILGNGSIQQQISKLAIENNIFIVAGTIPIISNKVIDKYYNSCIVFDNFGKIVTYYHKMHLFQYLDAHNTQNYNEHNIFLADNKISTFTIGCFSFGLGICYDLRFPELFRAYSGIDAIILPAAFTYMTGLDHWDILIRARAIENQCYFISSAQTGMHGGSKRFYGHSMIVNPWGKIISIIDEDEGIIVSKIEKSKILETREKIPALSNKIIPQQIIASN